MSTKTDARPRSRQTVTVDGQKYDSRMAAARALLEKGGITISDIAKKCGIAGSTVHTLTPEGAAMVAKNKAVRAAKTGNFTVNMLCEKFKVEKSVLTECLKAREVVCPTVKELEQKQNEANAKENTNSSAPAKKKTSKKSSSKKSSKKNEVTVESTTNTPKEDVAAK